MKRFFCISLFSFYLLAISNNILSMQLGGRITQQLIASKKHFHITHQTYSNNTPKKTITVSIECAKNIEDINNDAGKMYYFFSGAFCETGKHNRVDVKPSDILNWLMNNKSVDIDQVTNLTYADASMYLKNLSSYFDKADRAFEEKYNQTKSIPQTWEWFDGYFKEEVLVTISRSYKERLVRYDQEMREYAKKGIFFSPDGKTVIIDPSRARDKE